MNATDIESQVGAAAGLWTHAPVDWAGNEGVAKPGPWPQNASAGAYGVTTGTRPHKPVILTVAVTAVAATTASIYVGLDSVPTAVSVNYGTTPALGSTTAGTASQTQTVALTTLTTATLYYFRVTATNAMGSTTTNGTFTTA